MTDHDENSYNDTPVKESVSRRRDDPGAMDRRRSYDHAYDEFSAAHDIGVDLQGVKKSAIVFDLNMAQQSSLLNDQDVIAEGIEMVIDMIEDPGDTPLDDFLDHEIDLISTHEGSRGIVKGYEYAQELYRRRRDTPWLVRGLDLQRMIQHHIDDLDYDQEPAQHESMVDSYRKLEEMIYEFGPDWSESMEKTFKYWVTINVQNMDDQAKKLHPQDPLREEFLHRREGFNSVLRIANGDPYQCPPEEPEESENSTEVVAGDNESRGLFSAIRSFFG